MASRREGILMLKMVSDVLERTARNGDALVSTVSLARELIEAWSTVVLSKVRLQEQEVGTAQLVATGSFHYMH